MPGADRVVGGAARTIGIDRIACTGRGACAVWLPERITLDGWGYPIIDPTPVDARLAEQTVRVCPARALRAGLPLVHPIESCT